MHDGVFCLVSPIITYLFFKIITEELEFNQDQFFVSSFTKEEAPKILIPAAGSSRPFNLNSVSVHHKWMGRKIKLPLAMFMVNRWEKLENESGEPVSSSPAGQHKYLLALA